MVITFDFDTNVKRAFSEIDPNWKNYEGIAVCGTHTPVKEEVEEVIDFIRLARENGLPLYAECFGYQLCAIEYARNVLGIEDATSEEWGEGTFVVKKRKGLRVGFEKGESYWHNYEVDIEWEQPDHFFTAQHHPSYQSWKKNPHPLIVNFLKYAMAV